MTYKARFTHGSRHFDIDANEFSLYQDFVFPAADESLNISSPNVGSTSGGQVISKTPQDRWWAWSVRIMGTTIAQTHMAARRLSMWLSQAVEDKTDKVYFEYTPSYNVPAPIWGQHGAPYRFEVKAAIVDLDGSYYVAEIPERALILPISLLVGPYALGARQLLCQAKGLVYENTHGTEDGLSRGTIIGLVGTQLIPNPSFETNTTGWTAVDCTLAQTTDQAWIGSYGMRQVVSTTNTAAYAYYADVVTGTPIAQAAYTVQARFYAPAEMVGKNIGISIYETGGAAAAANTVLVNKTAVAGWNFISATGTVAQADRTALRAYLRIPAAATVEAGSWIIWDAVMMQAATEARPYFDGDQIGCVWTGTAHESTSTATAGYVRIKLADLPEFSARQGTICVALKHLADYASGANKYVFSDSTFEASYTIATDDWRLTDGTNTVEGAAQTFVSGDIDILHFVWSPGRLEIYLNGAPYAAGTTFTPWTLGDYLYIGSQETPAGQIGDTFMDFTIWDVALSAAQVLADYTDISAHINGGDGYGQRLSSIPYLWTKDGDNVVDNYCDATHNHYAIINGIPGTTEAYTEIEGTPSAAFSGIHLSNFTTKRYFSPSIFFVDSSGTADAGAVGGEAHVTLTDQSAAELSESGMSWTKSAYPEFSAMPFYILTRMKAASSVYARIQSYVSSATYGVNITTDYSRPVAIGSSSYYILRTIAGMTQKNYSGYDADTEKVEIYGFITSGTVNVSLDYAVMFPRPYLYCYGYAITKFMLKDNTITKITGGSAVGMIEVLKPIGDSIELSPNRYNILQSLMGCEDSDATLTTTLTYVIYATPRYRLV
ncbi:MAG: hypothetical protein WC455_14190 [Dehalococcoidia bacterium]|jgi:hypothetical protein